MRRTTVFLDDAVERDLKALARRRKKPVAALVREALAQYVASSREKPPPLRFLAAGRSGHRDTAERHEELVFAALEPHGNGRAARSRTRAPRAKQS